ncbi:hypothetical protein JTE90_005772 [Oedothorax gibbosus]|uniref:Uncharacterized protein n=1 Tax=Oedothorax gibbosus TaxID=931172 RepID=A0AAV6URR0_9ARAC|nr:hypothetical protein JTE90_005772 [Oedothorax gibbosus]
MLSSHKKAPDHLQWCWCGRKIEAGVTASARSPKKDVYPLPRIGNTLDCLRGAQYFSSKDLHSGYWQIEVDEAYRGKNRIHHQRRAP